MRLRYGSISPHPDTVGPVTRTAPYLAAVAAAAIPGMSPVRVQEVRPRPGARFRVGFVEDTQERRWVVRVPIDAIAAAQQEASVDLLALLARRLPFSVPAPAGFATVRERRRAMVYPLLDGRPLRFAGLPGGPAVAAEVGRAIAAVHNVDRRLYEQAMVDSYDAQETRRRHLVELDRGAETGRVPRRLLARWERMLDEVSLWRFAPAPLHGRLDAHHTLARFTDPLDGSTGQISAIVGWDAAKIGDPAEDLAAIVSTAPQDAVDATLEAYAMARREVPDPHLEQRARLVAEMRVLSAYLAAIAAANRRLVEEAVQALHALARDVSDETAAASPFPAMSVTYEPTPPDEQVYRAGSPTAVATEPPVDAGGSTPGQSAAAAADGGLTPSQTRSSTKTSGSPQPGSSKTDLTETASSTPVLLNEPHPSLTPAEPQSEPPTTPARTAARPAVEAPTDRVPAAETTVRDAVADDALPLNDRHDDAPADLTPADKTADQADEPADPDEPADAAALPSSVPQPAPDAAAEQTPPAEQTPIADGNDDEITAAIPIQPAPPPKAAGSTPSGSAPASTGTRRRDHAATRRAAARPKAPRPSEPGAS